MKLKLASFFLLFLLIFSASSVAGGLYNRLQSSLKGIKTLTGTFVQKTYMKDIDRTQVFKGRFYMKSPDKMKWVYTSKSTDVVYILGEKLIIYQPEENQAFITKTEGMGLSASPLRILLAKDLSKMDFLITESEDSIILTPKKDELMIKKIKLTISPKEHLIKKIELIDASGNQTVIEINNYSINPDIDSSVFQFHPPKGTTIVNQ